nr:Crp/Fnr family transcriptional regulator [Allomuricauda sp.]
MGISILGLEELYTYFKQHFDISDKDWELFSSHLKQRDFGKKQLVLAANSVESHLSFISEGAVRLYIPKEDDELTFGFVFAGSFVSAYDSFLTQKPSPYAIATLTKSVLWQISHSDLEKVYNTTEIGNFIGRKASEELFLKKSKRELSLLNETAEERYLKLFEERPELIREIPLKYLASYIGVTPQALSRIRRRIS